MIKQERLEGRNLVRTYSDTGKTILQQETGLKYGDAIDIDPCPYTYVETEDESMSEEISDDEAFKIIMESNGETEEGDITNEEALDIILGREEE